jgi:hypothetical protein
MKYYISALNVLSLAIFAVDQITKLTVLFAMQGFSYLEMVVIR